MKRPIGLILSAVVLSLSALFLLILTALMAVAALIVDHRPATAAMPHFAIFLILGFSVFYAILAVWAILTVIGILRLRTWARYSILVIGGGFACLGVLMAIGTVFSRSMLASMPTHGPAPDPHLMADMFSVLIALYLLIAATGVWWLVYFNLYPIRKLFSSVELASLPDTSANSLPQRPTAITVLACLYLLSALCCAMLAFTPMPSFLLGIILPVKAAHILYLTFALIMALLAYGLLQLKQSARLANIAFLLLGVCNVLLSLLPWYQNQFRVYMASFQTAFPGFPSQSPALFPYTQQMIYLSGVLCLATYAVIFWLLYRHRAAFEAPSRPTESIPN